MRKLFITGLALLYLAALLPGAARAVSEEDVGEVCGTEALLQNAPDEVEEILGETDLLSLDLNGITERLGRYAQQKLSGILQGALSSGVLLLTIVLLCQCAAVFCPEGQSPDYVTLGGVLAVAGVCVSDVRSFFVLGAETLHTLSDFSKVLLPTMAAAAAASGAVSASAAKYAATALYSDLLITAADRLILPLLYVFLVIVIVNAALSDGRLQAMADMIQWIVSGLMKLLVLAFTAYLTISGAIAGASDTVAAKLTKTALSTALPVVGGIVSDAAASVVAGAGIVRGAVGVFGAAAVLCVCLTPFLRLTVQYLVFKGAGGLSLMLGNRRLSGLISGLGTAFGMVFALTGCGALMLFISIVSSIRAVGP